jgi:hypothetical protein
VEVDVGTVVGTAATAGAVGAAAGADTSIRDDDATGVSLETPAAMSRRSLPATNPTCVPGDPL